MTVLKAIASGLGVGSAVYTNHVARKENERTRQYNLKLAQMQNQWNVEQWQRENEYNSPVAQVQRLKAAGLNPNLLYGGGVSNMASSSPQMTAGAAASPTPLVGMPNALNEYLQQRASLEQMDAQTEFIRSQTVGQTISNDINSFEKEVLDIMREDGYQGSVAEARAKYQEYQAKLQKQTFDNEVAKYDYLLDELEHDKVIRDFERSLLPEKRKLFNASVREAVATSNIKVFLDDMKALDFFTDKGIEAIQSVLGIIGAAGKFKDPMEILETYGPKGTTFSKRYHVK